MAAHGGETLAVKDITEHKWAMQYVNSNKKVVLLISQNKDQGKLGKDKPFSYDRILRLDYEDPDSVNLILLVDCSKGVHKIFVSKDLLMKDSCGPESI